MLKFRVSEAERLLRIHSLYFVYFYVYTNRDWKGRLALMSLRVIAALQQPEQR